MWLVASEVTELLDDEVFIAQLDEFVDDIYHSLNESGCGLMHSCLHRDHNIIYIYCISRMQLIYGDVVCSIKVLRTESKGEYTTEEITAMFQTFLAVFNQFALILLLTVYLMYVGKFCLVGIVDDASQTTSLKPRLLPRTQVSKNIAWNV
eukprot:COSAG01_NODE_447_length_16933_cov_9.983426_9_plen_150_part_00